MHSQPGRALYILYRSSEEGGGGRGPLGVVGALEYKCLRWCEREKERPSGAHEGRLGNDEHVRFTPKHASVIHATPPIAHLSRTVRRGGRRRQWRLECESCTPRMDQSPEEDGIRAEGDQRRRWPL
ncbi:hypothetical protein BHE74_00014814 [Ensete ventricosum]|uniref:Uncharacterized protein n=1 Tax=Ensete ventricosum TaxID=4639 RepID=A0A445MBQ4_ENSVE|nr:hypothetical protein BHE74_00014814 [Ensete ventricosum]RZR71618.1 hypothetical protein BHM03_00006112 [Ensete ventricosum]